MIWMFDPESGPKTDIDREPRGVSDLSPVKGCYLEKVHKLAGALARALRVRLKPLH